MRRALWAALMIPLLCACGGASDAQPSGRRTSSGDLPAHFEIRADRLPPPYATRSTAHSARIIERPKEATLDAPPGFHVALWASGFVNPRNMIQAPSGEVFVADTGEGRIHLLRDGDGDGKPESRSVFAENLDEPFGLALRGDFLYVGDGDAVVKFAWRAGQKIAAAEPVRVMPLPTGGHATRNLLFNGDGSKMYIAIGSMSNVNDETSAPMRAAITEANPDGSGRRVFASGLRNPVGLAWNPANHTLWTAVNERDGLGDDLAPDFITEVRAGAFYGWPFAYAGRNVDPRRRGEHPELVAKSVVPSLLIQAHSAPIGLAFYDGTMFPPRYRGGAFVALHGSWNRSQLTGYKIIHVPFREGQPAGGYDDFLTGWLLDDARGRVWGRPAGVLVLHDGSLLVSDDVRGEIWRVSFRTSP